MTPEKPERSWREIWRVEFGRPAEPASPLACVGTLISTAAAAALLLLILLLVFIFLL